MKTLEDIQVSLYPNRFSKSPVQTSVFQILSDIAKGKYAPAILAIRRYYAEHDKQAVEHLKEQLSCFTASGTFSGGHSADNLNSYNGICLLDFDHPKNLSTLKQKCQSDPHTLFCFQSPTDGYKVAVMVESPQNRHVQAYHQTVAYYEKLTGEEPDKACKNINRLCNVSYDPDCYIATFYESFHLADMGEKNVCPAADPINLPHQPLPAGTEKEFVKSYFFLNPVKQGNRHTTLFKLACEACKRGYDPKSILTEICAIFHYPDFSKKDIESPLLSGYKYFKEHSGDSLSSLHPASENVKVSKCQYNPLEETSEEEEAYWEGEDLRRKTPFFPDNLYNNIPDLLTRCLVDDLPERERDVLLLSCITAFSSILPQTWGVYRNKRYSPHLFELIIAPAGSGKSIAGLARKLLEDIHLHILQESEIADKTYKIKKMEWLSECSRKMKKQTQITPEDEPKEPPFKMLVISSTTSNTRMQMQLRDNGALGGIIFDTEIQALTNANQLDCGHFDEILCKAFEHETISSSYKANGIKPIIIRCPKLALLLTGTVEQLHQLIPTPESGLFSRILFYTYRSKPIWQEMGSTSSVWDDHYDALAQNASRLFRYCEENPVYFSFTRNHWNILNKTFGKMLAEVATEGNDHLQAIVKRHGFMTMRIAMVLTRLRQFEKGMNTHEVECVDIDFQTALDIVLCCYEHSRLLLTSLSSGKIHPLKNPNSKKDFFNELPSTFTTDEAINLGLEHLLSRSTVLRYIRQLINLKIKKISHGTYQKTDLNNPI